MTCVLPHPRFFVDTALRFCQTWYIAVPAHFFKMNNSVFKPTPESTSLIYSSLMWSYCIWDRIWSSVSLVNLRFLVTPGRKLQFKLGNVTHSEVVKKAKIAQSDTNLSRTQFLLRIQFQVTRFTCFSTINCSYPISFLARAPALENVSRWPLETMTRWPGGYGKGVIEKLFSPKNAQ